MSVFSVSKPVLMMMRKASQNNASSILSFANDKYASFTHFSRITSKQQPFHERLPLPHFNKPMQIENPVEVENTSNFGVINLLPFNARLSTAFKSSVNSSSVGNRDLSDFRSSVPYISNVKVIESKGSSSIDSSEQSIDSNKGLVEYILILTRVVSDESNVTPVERTLAIGYLTLENKFNTQSGDRHNAILTLDEVGRTFLSADSKGLASIDEVSNSICPSNLSLVQAQSSSRNLRETLGTKLNEKFCGDMLNHGFSKVVGEGISIGFNRSLESNVIKLCQQPNGDYIVTYRGKHFILDLKTIKSLSGCRQGKGLINMHSGGSMDFCSFSYNYKVFLDSFKSHSSSEVRVLVRKFINNLVELKYNSEYSEEEKSLVFIKSLLEYNLNLGTNKGNIPVISGDYANSKFGTLLKERIIEHREGSRFFTDIRTSVEELSYSKRIDTVSVYGLLKDKYNGHFGAEGLRELKHEVNNILDN